MATSLANYSFLLLQQTLPDKEAHTWETLLMNLKTMEGLSKQRLRHIFPLFLYERKTEAFTSASQPKAIVMMAPLQRYMTTWNAKRSRRHFLIRTTDLCVNLITETESSLVSRCTDGA